MSNPNQPIRSPFGDIATVSTPALDRMGAIWYQEEKERKTKAAAAEKAEQDDYTEKLTNIRAADVPEYRENYNKWASKKAELIKLGKKGDATEYQKKSDEALALYAQLNQFVNRSLEEKKNPNRQVAAKDRSDDFDEIMEEYKKTPTSKLNTKYKTKSGKEIVLSDIEPLVYTPQQMDFTTLAKTGLGTLKKGNLKYVKLDENTQKKVVPEFYNNPVIIADVVANEMNRVRKGVREVEANLGFLEGQEPKIEAEYQEYVNSPEYKEIYGVNPPAFKQPATRAEKLTQLFAKDLFLKNKPRYVDGEQEVTEEYKVKKEAAKNARELAEQKAAERRKFNYAVKLIGIGNSYKTPKDRGDFYSNIGVGSSQNERNEYDIIERFAMILRGEPVNVDIKAAGDVEQNGVKYKDLTPVFQSMNYQKDKEEIVDGKTVKGANKTFGAILFDPKTKDVVISYRNADDKNTLMAGTKLEGGKQLSNSEQIVFKAKSTKDAKIRLINHVAAAAALNEKAIDFLHKIVEAEPQKPTQEKPASKQSSTGKKTKNTGNKKEAPKDKENNKSKSKGKPY